MFGELINKWDEILKAKAAIGEIRVWNGVKYQKQTDGSWKPLSQKVKSPEKEEIFFGENFSQFSNRPYKAIDFLLKKKTGQVIGALEREGLGKIDIVYGNNKGGLCHIRNKHFVHASDFSSLEEMRDRIVDLLENGKIGRQYDNGTKIDIYKENYKLILKRTLVYDEEDRFKEKIWVLTSYETSKKEEDKIRKAVSEETALEKDQVTLFPCNSSVNSRKNHLEKGQATSVISQCSFSECKDRPFMNIRQQIVDEIFEKAKKKSPVGTEKTWGGKVYIMTSKGWRLKRKGHEKAKNIESSSEEDQTQDLNSQVNSKLAEYASKASDKALQDAIKDKDTKPEVVAAAKAELEKRSGKAKGSQSEENVVDKKLDQLKQDLTSQLHSKLSEMTSFKKITQTYVKVEGKTIVVKMKGDDKYKATSPGFKMESKPYESLADFKKRVKEEFIKKVEKVDLNFKSISEVKDYQNEQNKAKNLLSKDQFDAIKKSLDEKLKNYPEISKRKKNMIEEALSDKEYFLKDYAEFSYHEKLYANKRLMDIGDLPIADGILYSKWNEKKYKVFNNYEGADIYYNNNRSVYENEEQKEALVFYTESKYGDIRDFNLGKLSRRSDSYQKRIERYSNHIEDFIKNHSLDENLVLNRRMEFNMFNPNNLNKWAFAEIGDVIEDKSFSSFSLRQLSTFGNDLQITLLAKKGDQISNINNRMDEHEYLAQRNSKYRVLARGMNSIVVEMV